MVKKKKTLTPLQRKAILMLEVLHEKDKELRKINDKFKQLNGEPDFANYLCLMPSDLQNRIIRLLDEILGEELASYWLYECQIMKGGGRITHADGKEFKLKTIRDLEEYLLARPE